MRTIFIALGLAIVLFLYGYISSTRWDMTTINMGEMLLGRTTTARQSTFTITNSLKGSMYV